MTWFMQQRLEWIAETLRVFRYINREHLCLKFGISIPQAAHDFAQFQRERPGVMVYNKCSKRYERAETR